jgi:hypothetical protein
MKKFFHCNYLLDSSENLLNLEDKKKTSDHFLLLCKHLSVDDSGIEEIILAELVVRYVAAISCPLWMPSVLGFKNTEILSSSVVF